MIDTLPLHISRALETLGLLPPPRAEKAQPAPVERQFKGEFYKPGQEIPF